MPASYNATDNEVLYQQILLTQPITIPAGGSVTMRIVSITKNQDDNEENTNG